MFGQRTTNAEHQYQINSEQLLSKLTFLWEQLYFR